jgi:hypothetical protein
LKTIDYKLNILGLTNKKGSISIYALKEITDALIKGSDRVLRLFVEGRSTKSGKYPDWLKKSLDFTITGIKAGSTVIDLEAPVLKEAIPLQIIQRQLEVDTISPDDTAISILSKSIADACAQNMESDYFDSGVLDALLSFNTITKKYAKELIITSKTKTADNFKISSEEIKKIKKIKIETPTPHTIVIAGFFNLIENSNRRFQLKLEDGKSIEGIMDPLLVDSENMRELWGKKVTLKGKAIYKPSGKLRSLEAQLVKPFESGDKILQKIPGARKHTKQIVELVMEKKSNQQALRKMWGKWPGDESIEELLALLDGRPHR